MAEKSQKVDEKTPQGVCNPIIGDEYVLVRKDRGNNPAVQTRVTSAKGFCIRLQKVKRQKGAKPLPPNTMTRLKAHMLGEPVATLSVRNMIPRDHEFAFTVTNQLQWLSNVATGIMNGASPLTAQYASDWASLQALFDEWILDKYVYKYSLAGYGKATSGSSTAFSGNSHHVLAYDPDDNTALASTAAGCVYDEHKLVLAPNGVITLTAPEAGHLHTFTATPPKGDGMVFSGSGTAVASVGHIWQSTATGQFVPYGWIKGYWDTTETAATVVTAGIEFYSIRCRRRT